jgi:hypothetical protein
MAGTTGGQAARNFGQLHTPVPMKHTITRADRMPWIKHERLASRLSPRFSNSQR